MDLADLVQEIKDKKDENLVSKIFNGIPRRVNIVQPMKSDDWVKVHSFGRLCPREEAICSKFNIVRREEIDPRLLFTFNMGSALGDMIRDSWLGPAQYLMGTWKCKQCGVEFGKAANPKSERILMPNKCEVCDSSESWGFTYIEEDLADNRHGIVGHPDAFLNIDGEYYIGEIKTARSMGYTKVQKGSGRHDSVDSTYLLQLRIYLWLSGYDKGVFIFINKDATPSLKQDNYLTCIPVEHDQKIIDERVINWIDVLRDSIALEEIPERQICTKPTDRRAKDCSVANRCFYGRF